MRSRRRRLRSRRWWSCPPRRSSKCSTSSTKGSDPRRLWRVRRMERLGPGPAASSMVNPMRWRRLPRRAKRVEPKRRMPQSRLRRCTSWARVGEERAREPAPANAPTMKLRRSMGCLLILGLRRLLREPKEASMKRCCLGNCAGPGNVSTTCPGALRFGAASTALTGPVGGWSTAPGWSCSRRRNPELCPSGDPYP